MYYVATIGGPAPYEQLPLVSNISYRFPKFQHLMSSLSLSSIDAPLVCCKFLKGGHKYKPHGSS